MQVINSFYDPLLSRLWFSRLTSLKFNKPLLSARQTQKDSGLCLLVVAFATSVSEIEAMKKTLSLTDDCYFWCRTGFVWTSLIQNLQLFIRPNWNMNFSLNFSLKLLMIPQKSHAYINTWINRTACVFGAWGCLLFILWFIHFLWVKPVSVVMVAPSVTPKNGNTWLNFPPHNDWHSCARTHLHCCLRPASDVICLQVLSRWNGCVSPVGVLHTF